MAKFKDVFISHSHSDERIATALTNCIVNGTNLGYRDILCTSHANVKARLKPGDNIIGALRKHLENCRIFIPIISTESVTRNFVLFEIGGAWALRHKVMPVVVERQMIKNMPAVLSGLVYTKFKSKKELDVFLYAIEKECFTGPAPKQAVRDAAIEDYLAEVK